MKKKKRKQPVKKSAMEVLTNKMVMEKGYQEKIAEWRVGRLEQLIDHMHYGHAVIAYSKKDGSFRMATGTLINYQQAFRREYDHYRISKPIVYWDVMQQGWRCFLPVNFLEWRPVV